MMYDDGRFDYLWWQPIVSNMRHHMSDGVEVAVDNGQYFIHRYIDDSDEDGDTIYETHDYLVHIPLKALRRSLGVNCDFSVYNWIKNNLIAEQSNSLDKIVAYLKANKIPFEIC